MDSPVALLAMTVVAFAALLVLVLRTKLPAFLVLILVCMGVLSVFLLQNVRENNLDVLQKQLVNQARLISDDSATYFASGDTESLDAMADKKGRETGSRITIIAVNGTILGDSEEDPASMDNHADRPEVIQALTDGVGSSIRHSATLKCDMLYVAVPVMVDGATVGIARSSLSLAGIDESLEQINEAIVAGIAVTAVVTILLALWISRATTRQLKQLTRMSREITRGEINQRIEVSSGDEVGELARAFNQMSARLGEMMAILTTERDKMAAIVSTMDSGVVIVNDTGKVNMVNGAARELLGLFGEGWKEQTFINVARDHEMDEVLQNCFRTGKQQEGMVESETGRRFIRVVATPLEDGALMLFHDLTRLRRLETVRRDFIANISHELRTPISSLKVLTETLQDGAIEDSSIAQDFLGKINAEVDRLAQMVNELGQLSRIENGDISPRMVAIDVGEVIRRAADRLRMQVERKELSLLENVPAGLPKALAGKDQIEQVMVNLIHNALKFTSRGGKITLSVRADGNYILVSIADTGEGISAEDLPRIFERFYKVDKARSGSGTGLGLAIARHIVEAHGGKIWVESIEGRGSTFTFSLPVSRT